MIKPLLLLLEVISRILANEAWFLTYHSAEFSSFRRVQEPAQFHLTMSFSFESIAGRPLCCQQRVGPCTRLEHGVPFFVLAPQI